MFAIRFSLVVVIVTCTLWCTTATHPSPVQTDIIIEQLVAASSDSVSASSLLHKEEPQIDPILVSLHMAMKGSISLPTGSEHKKHDSVARGAITGGGASYGDVPPFITAAMLETPQLQKLEWALCGGRWRPEWTFQKASGKDIESIIHRLEHHVVCSTASVSMCFNESLGGGVKTGASDSITTQSDRLLRHIGSTFSTTVGLAASKNSFTPTPFARSYISESSNSAMYGLLDIVMDMWGKLQRMFFTPASTRTVLELHLLPQGLNTRRAGKRAAEINHLQHVDPDLAAQLVPSRTREENICYYVEATQEIFCTQSLHPLLELLGGPLAARCTSHKQHGSSCALPRRTLLGSFVANLATFFKNAYHSAEVMITRADGTKRDVHSEVTTDVRLTFVMTEPQEVEAFRRHIQRALKLFDDSKQPYSVSGSAKHLLAASEKWRETMPVATRAPPTQQDHCEVSTLISQRGGVDAALNVQYNCTRYPSDGALQETVVEVLLTIPAQTLIVFLDSKREHFMLTEAIDTLTGKTLQGGVPAPHSGFQLVGLRSNPDNQNIAVVLRTVLGKHRLTGSIPTAAGFRTSHSTTFLAAFPFLRMEDYPPNMNKPYVLPQTISRAAYSAECRTPYTAPVISHQEAFEVLFRDLVTTPYNTSCPTVWHYQRQPAGRLASFNMPLTDPGMVFNVIAMSGCLVAVMVYVVSYVLDGRKLPVWRHSQP